MTWEDPDKDIGIIIQEANTVSANHLLIMKSSPSDQGENHSLLVNSPGIKYLVKAA